MSNTKRASGVAPREKLTPSEGKLEFDVNFYERGLFPPSAYHSEGHQDGMASAFISRS